jgi:hypothetical protein
MIFFDFISIFTIILCVFGIMGNIISIKICSKKELRKTPTFIFMSFISAINILKLLTIMIFILILQFFVTNIYKLNSLFLNICFFLIFWKYQSSVYLMVRLNLWLFKLWSYYFYFYFVKLMMLFDQLMCVKHVLWRKSLFNYKKAILSSFVVILFFFLINFHLNFTVKYNFDENSTLIDFLASSKTLIIWAKVRMIFI